MNDANDEGKSKERSHSILEDIDDDIRKFRERMFKMREKPGKSLVKNDATPVLKQREIFEQLGNIPGPSSSKEQTISPHGVLKCGQSALLDFKGIKPTKTHTHISEEHHAVEDQPTALFDEAHEVQEAFCCIYNIPEIDDHQLDVEFDTLGEEIALDDDSSYLDDVLKTPDAPSYKPEA